MAVAMRRYTASKVAKSGRAILDVALIAAFGVRFRGKRWYRRSHYDWSCGGAAAGAATVALFAVNLSAYTREQSRFGCAEVSIAGEVDSDLSLRRRESVEGKRKEKQRAWLGEQCRGEPGLSQRCGLDEG